MDFFILLRSSRQLRNLVKTVRFSGNTYYWLQNKMKRRQAESSLFLDHEVMNEKNILPLPLMKWRW